jgi:hypothetical protein
MLSLPFRRLALACVLALLPACVALAAPVSGYKW